MTKSHFQKLQNLFFSNKEKNGNKTSLVENGKIIDNNTDIAKELNNVFKNAVDSLNVQENQCIVSDKY